jgi:integrase
MPRSATPLNDLQIRALEPRTTRYSIADGNGLVLEVMPTGSKIWRFRYTLNGARQPLVTIGDYRKISLRVARARAQKYAEMVASGQSPVATARQDRGVEKRVESLRDGAELYLTSGLHGKADDYRRTIRRVLEKDVLPVLGARPVGEITADDVRAICGQISERGSPKMALHTRNVIKRLYDYLNERQLVSGNPAQAVPARFIATSESRTRVLSAQEIGVTMRAIYASNIRRPLKLALHLLVLTMVRKSQLVEARWSEFDLSSAVWNVRGTRSREDTSHVVYLSTQALAMLDELRKTRMSTTYLFPTVRGFDRPIAHSTLNQAVKALGLDVEHFVLHDFRRTASLHLRAMAAPADQAAAAALVVDEEREAVSDDAEEANPRADDPREIAQRWADFVDLQIGASAPGVR